MIFWTFVLVLTLGGVIGVMCLQPPTPEANLLVSPAYSQMQKRQALKINAQEFTVPSTDSTHTTTKSSGEGNTLDPRGPASALPPIEAGTTADIKLGCSDVSRMPFDKNVAQVRLMGHVCTAHEQLESTEVRNISNGASATIFYANDNAFTTDYLTISSGENKIQITHTFKSGNREEHDYLFDRKGRITAE